MKYLEEVESNNEEPSIQHKTYSHNAFSTPNPRDKEYRGKIAAQEIQIEDKERTIQLLQEELKQSRNREQENIKKRYHFSNIFYY